MVQEKQRCWEANYEWNTKLTFVSPTCSKHRDKDSGKTVKNITSMMNTIYHNINDPQVYIEDFDNKKC